MIISAAQVGGVLTPQNRQTEKTERVSASKLNRNSDMLTISSEAKVFGMAKEVMLKSPEIRADKVNNLRNKIDSGTYNLPADQIAAKMLMQNLADEMAWR